MLCAVARCRHAQLFLVLKEGDFVNGWLTKSPCLSVYFFLPVRPGRAKHHYFALFFCPVLQENHSPKSWVCQFSRLTSKSRRLNFESKLSLPQSPTFRSQSRHSPPFCPVSLSLTQFIAASGRYRTEEKNLLQNMNKCRGVRAMALQLLNRRRFFIFCRRVYWLKIL